MVDVGIASTMVQAPTSSGTQDITITGIGTPKGFFVESVGNSANGTAQNHSRFMFGASISASGYYASGTFDQDNQSVSNSGLRRGASGFFIMPFTNSSTASSVADIDSVITDGIRLNWTNPGGAVYLKVTFIYGDDVQCSIHTTLNIGTEDSARTYSPSYSDGRVVRFGFHFFNNSGFGTETGINNARAYVGMSCLHRDGSTQQVSHSWWSRDNLSVTTGRGRIMRDNRICQRVEISSTGKVSFTTSLEADYPGDGTLDVYTRDGSAQIWGVHLLVGCKPDVNIEVLDVSDDIDTDASGTDKVTLGWTPVYARLIAADINRDSTINQGGGSPPRGVIVGYGDADDLAGGGEQCVSHQMEQVNLILTNTDNRTLNELDQIMALLDDSGSRLLDITVSSWDADGITFSKDTPSGSALLVVGMFLGQDNLSSGGTHGQARAAALGTAVSVAAGSGRGQARTTAQGTAVAVGAVVTRGQARATSSGTEIAVGAAAARGQARATSNGTAISIGAGSGRGSARSTATGIVSAVGTGSGRGGSRARATGTVVAVGTGVSRGSARTTSVALVTEHGTGIARGSSRAVSNPPIIVMGRGIARGSARVFADQSMVRATGIARGQSRAVGIGSITITCLAGSPTDLDQRILPRALAILQQLGRTVTFSTPATATYDPSTGETTFAGTTPEVGQVSPPLQYEARYVDGDKVKRGDVQLILAADQISFTPTIKHVVQFDGTEWRVVEVTPVYSGEQIAVWVLQLRGGGLPSTTSAVNRLDDTLPARALEIVTRLGRTVSWVRETDSFDPATGENTETPTVTSIISSPPLQYVDAYVDGDAVRAGDMMLIVPDSQLTAPIDLSDHFVIDSARWNVVRADPVYSGGLVVAWILQVRAGGLPSVAGLTTQNALDARLPARVQTLIGRFGKRVHFFVPTHDIYSTGTGENLQKGICEFCEPAVVDDDRETFRQVSKQETTTLYLRGHQLGFTPLLGMSVQFDSKEWECTLAEPIYTGGRIGAWRLEVVR